MEDSERTGSWREEGERKLKRLHSLLFGAELSLEKGEPQTSLGLSLRLLGFLDSECKTEQDRAFIAPIQKQSRQKLCAARDKLVQSGDFHVSQQGRTEEAWIFKRTEALDLETIKQSKYYKPFFDATSQLARRLAQTSATDNQKPMEIPAYQTSLLGNKALGSNGSKETYDGGTFKGSRGLMQAKITSLYGNGSSKSPDSLGKSQSLPARNSYTPPDHHQTRMGPFRGNKYSHYCSQINDEERDDDSWANRKRRRYDEMSRAPAKARSASDEDDILEKEDSRASGFVTAKQKLALDSAQKWAASASASSGPSASPSSVGTTNQCGVGYGNLRNPGLKTLGMNRRGVRGNFIPPVRANSANGPSASTPSQRGLGASENGLEDSTRKCLELLTGPDGELPEKLRNLEPRLLEHVSNEIMDQDPNVRWSDIGGLEHAKKCVTEMVIWPLIRPDIFKGCRSPGKGLLLFGPPGTGKTMIGKAIAGEAKATFFYISSSSLTSKWIGEGEKLVRALFGVASCRQPAVIFIDEIDSLLSQRKADGEHESSRRLKTQFLIEMEGFASGEERLLFIGATNRPQELDEAARRRLSKRLYIPLPSAGARAWIVKNLLKKDGLLTLSDDDIDTICKNSEGYSGSDMSNLVKEASMGPLREVLMEGMDISNLKKDEMRPVMLKDFLKALQNVKPSVSSNELGAYEDWNRQFGSHSF